MDFKRKRVLVTGAGGFIGSHLCEALVNAGASVTAFLRYTSRSDFQNLEFVDARIRSAIKIIRGDLRDELSVRQSMKGMDGVFHLGAIISVPYSFESPTEYIGTNVMGTAHVLAAARDADVSFVVHTSTSEVFGTGQYTPMDEAHPLCAQSPYAASKIGGDKLAESYYRTYGLPVVILRPFNTYGPRQSARAIIPTIISQALVSHDIIVGLPTPKRDLTFVQDTVRAFMLASQTPKAAGEYINVGTGAMWSVSEMVQHIGNVLGKNLRMKSVSERKRPKQSEVYRLQCNASKAKRLLGWSKKTSLDDGLRQTIEWMQSHPAVTESRAKEYHF
jgi:dTDP-glucose 4,6-dehydratase